MNYFNSYLVAYECYFIHMCSKSRCTSDYEQVPFDCKDSINILFFFTVPFNGHWFMWDKVFKLYIMWICHFKKGLIPHMCYTWGNAVWGKPDLVVLKKFHFDCSVLWFVRSKKQKHSLSVFTTHNVFWKWKKTRMRCGQAKTHSGHLFWRPQRVLCHGSHQNATTHCDWFLFCHEEILNFIGILNLDNFKNYE